MEVSGRVPMIGLSVVIIGCVEMQGGSSVIVAFPRTRERDSDMPGEQSSRPGLAVLVIRPIQRRLPDYRPCPPLSNPTPAISLLSTSSSSFALTSDSSARKSSASLALRESFCCTQCHPASSRKVWPGGGRERGLFSCRWYASPPAVQRERRK